MKIQEVILKAMAGKLKWWEAAESIGVTDRTMRRWRERYQERGYSGCGTTRSLRTGLATVLRRSSHRGSRKRSPTPKRIAVGKAGAPPPPLRYGSGKAPAQGRTLDAFWAGKEVGFNPDGAPPRTPLIYFCMANRTDHLLIKTGHLDVLPTPIRPCS